jgi:hypothetical protein
MISVEFRYGFHGHCNRSSVVLFGPDEVRCRYTFGGHHDHGRSSPYTGVKSLPPCPPIKWSFRLQRTLPGGRYCPVVTALGSMVGPSPHSSE